MLDRRQLLTGSLGAGLLAALYPKTLGSETPASEELVGVLPFRLEAEAWLREQVGEMLGNENPERRFGSGLGGRKIFDLETLDRKSLIVPSERFFIRTFTPEDLGDGGDWSIELTGLVREPSRVTVSELRRRARPQGAHLLECSGNSGEHSFGLISAAQWSGVPALEVLERAKPDGKAAVIEVVGHDLHLMPSFGSRPGASWIFTPEQLAETGAFFATEMNGAPLMNDHGFPVRLVVPGWYGCSCIKWVESVRWLAADVKSSGQMREFAARTHQDGVPDLALHYAPPTIDPAALPVRVELWRTGKGHELRLHGILWGGSRPVEKLGVRCGAEGPWAPVERLGRAASPSTWRMWSHRMDVPPPGPMEIRLRVDDPGVRTRRLDRGYYARTVEVPAL